MYAEAVGHSGELDGSKRRKREQRKRSFHISASICISGSSARSMSPDPSLSMFISQDPCLSIHMYLRIHVSASICISGSSARSTSPDPCLRFMSQHPLIRIRCMIHVSVFMSRHPYLWILSKIRISAFIPVDPAHNRHGGRFVWPCAGETLRSRSSLVFRRQTHILSCRDAFLVALRRRNANFDLRRRVLCGHAQGKQSDRGPL